MPYKVQAVVVREKNAPAIVETIIVPDPGPGEALVNILTCGVCHTDLHYKLGGIGDEFPYLLGHEATGVVSAVGEGVTEVAPGDPELACGVRPVPCVSERISIHQVEGAFEKMHEGKVLRSVVEL